MIYDLRKELQPGDIVITKKGFEFERTQYGYLDKTTKLEWEIEFKTEINQYQAEKWAKEKNKRLPIKEEFKLAESHGIRELPDMQWNKYFFWSSTLCPGYSYFAYVFFGYDGYVYYYDRVYSFVNVAARLVIKTNNLPSED